MARRYRRSRRNDNTPEELFSVIAGFLILGLGYAFYENRAHFLQITIWIVLALLFLLTLFFAIKKLLSDEKRKNFEKLIAQVRASGKEEEINNFINRFGSEGKKGDWEYMNYRFTWDRIADLEDILSKNFLPIRKDRAHNDTGALLRFYIKEKEGKITQQSILGSNHIFNSLSGTDFEHLLVRLFESMGYAVQHIGKSADQGGDLIANKDGERILIQAKRYKNWSTGNEAVQQVLAAMQFYNCNKGMVISTSENFTPAAQQLAHATNIELISKARVSEMLSEHLKEVWN
jgi:HJR/Mrr/RecB family endonuclease